MHTKLHPTGNEKKKELLHKEEPLIILTVKHSHLKRRDNLLFHYYSEIKVLNPNYQLI
jgi:hypothetical protein